jgi:signal transduction histidine kinase
VRLVEIERGTESAATSRRGRGTARAALARAGGIALVAAIYFVAGKLGLRLTRVHSAVTTVWPPTGIALAALIRFSPRLWPGVLLGAFLVNVTIKGMPFTTVIGIAIGNTLEAVIGAWLVTRFASGRKAFDRAIDTIRFIVLAGLLATATSATIGVLSLELGHRADWESFHVIWLTWWFGDMGGALLLAPALLLAGRWSFPLRNRARAIEAVVTFVVLLACCLLVFGGCSYLPKPRYPAHFVCVPPLLWAAFRFGPFAASLASLMVAVISLNGTLHAFGPFSANTPTDALLLLQSFMCVTAMLPLVLAAAVRERDATEAAARETARELERSNADLERFAHAASHDLKEPLRTVASFAQLLERRYGDELGPDGQEFIRFIVDGAVRMERLIRDMLAYSVAGSTGLHREAVASDDALAEALASLQAGIADAGAIVTRDPLPVVEADRGQFVQLFQNLVGNAVKFRGERPPRIHVSARRDGEQWLFSVRDNGIGIDPRFADRVFTMFQRVNAREKYDGSGIGLALCKRIVERHGGRISFESQPGGGSTFYFSLPAN